MSSKKKVLSQIAEPVEYNTVLGKWFFGDYSIPDYTLGNILSNCPTQAQMLREIKDRATTES